MRARVVVLVLTVVLLPAARVGPALGWGAAGHRLVTEYAVDRMPGPLGDLFRANRPFLVCYSTLPDTWWGCPDLLSRLPPGLENPTGVNGPRELSQHVFAVDGPVYPAARGEGGALVVSPMTRERARALCERFAAEDGGAAALAGDRRDLDQGPAEALFERFGQNPWAVEDRVADLAGAMREGRWERALLLATVLGHYVADAHVPLHAALDRIGTSHPNPLVRGIHYRWESGLLRRYEGVFRTLLSRGGRGPARGAEDLARLVFDALSRSGSLVAGILEGEDLHTRALCRGRDPETVRAEEGKRFFGRAYHAGLFRRQGVNVVRRLDASIDAIQVVWLVAWERAGRPRPPRGLVVATPLVAVEWKAGRIVPWRGSSAPASPDRSLARGRGPS